MKIREAEEKVKRAKKAQEKREHEKQDGRLVDLNECEIKFLVLDLSLIICLTRPRGIAKIFEMNPLFHQHTSVDFSF